VNSHENNVAKHWLGKNTVFLTALLYLVLRLLFSNLLGVNEHDVLAVGRQFANPSWIPADWYLNLDSGYRLTFNLLLYPFLKLMPLLWVSILGRLGCYVLFALVLQKYARALGIPAVFVIPALFFTTEVQYIITGEWMLKALEAKTLAYAFLLLALILLYERRFVASALSLGLSVSLHVLVGGYGTVTLLAVLVFDSPRLRPSFRVFAWAVAGYLVAASLGLISIVRNLATTDAENAVRAGLVYVRSRVPHHVLPSNWVAEYGKDLWRPVAKVVLSAALCSFAVLRPARPFQRTLAIFALSTSIFALLGFGLYFTDNIHLLKYYFFRLPVVMLPFSAFLLAFSYFSTWNPDRLLRDLPKVRFVAGIAVSALLVLWAAIPFARGLLTLIRDPSYFVCGESLESPKRHMYQWIKTHLPHNAIVMIPPLEERFYVGAERAQFVSYKHSPQSEEDILEWYERIVLLNNSQSFHDFEVDWTSLAEQYDRLPASNLLHIRSKYDVGYYVTAAGRDLSFPVVYRNDRYVVYQIDSGIGRGP
jgi:hypothetical protein